MADNPAESATENASDPAAESSGKTKLPTANSTAITAGAPVLVAAPQEVGETAPPYLSTLASAILHNYIHIWLYVTRIEQMLIICS